MASKKRRKKNPIELKNEERSINKAKKHARRTKQQRPPRQRDWLDHGNADETDVGFERIMPLDESDRRRHVESLINTSHNSDDPASNSSASEDDQIGLVTEVLRGGCTVKLARFPLLCQLTDHLRKLETGYTNPLTVGDQAHVIIGKSDQHFVDAVMPRRNWIARPAPGKPHLQQLLAANVDQLLIVAAWRNPSIWHELIDRYIITAERNAIKPIIVVNKIDLADEIAAIYADLAHYQAVGYTVILTSAEQGIGLEQVSDHLRGKITAVAGLSGVGKSSLLSAVLPGFNLRTGAVSDDTGQGTHTTTHSQMLPFAGGYVIDTPGIREFGLVGLQPEELIAYYPDLLRASLGCKFSDCTHTHEPACGVQAALADGTISPIRYHSYTTIRESL